SILLEYSFTLFKLNIAKQYATGVAGAAPSRTMHSAITIARFPLGRLSCRAELDNIFVYKESASPVEVAVACVPVLELDIAASTAAGVTAVSLSPGSNGEELSERATIPRSVGDPSFTSIVTVLPVRNTSRLVDSIALTGAKLLGILVIWPRALTTKPL